MVETGEAAPTASPVIPLKVEFTPSALSVPEMTSTIRSKRIKARLTLAQLAEQIDVHPQTLRSWEIGDTIPSQKNKRKLADLLGKGLFDPDK